MSTSSARPKSREALGPSHNIKWRHVFASSTPLVPYSVSRPPDSGWLKVAITRPHLVRDNMDNAPGVRQSGLDAADLAPGIRPGMHVRLRRPRRRSEPPARLAPCSAVTHGQPGRASAARGAEGARDTARRDSGAAVAGDLAEAGDAPARRIPQPIRLPCGFARSCPTCAETGWSWCAWSLSRHSLA
jgi:hypothetical protein